MNIKFYEINFEDLTIYGHNVEVNTYSLIEIEPFTNTPYIQLGLEATYLVADKNELSSDITFTIKDKGLKNRFLTLKGTFIAKKNSEIVPPSDFVKIAEAIYEFIKSQIKENNLDIEAPNFHFSKEHFNGVILNN